MNDKTLIALHMPKEEVDEARALANKDSRSFANWIVAIIREKIALAKENS